ncbi:MAG: AAA family ATPase [Planctomycetota bacterium]
MDACIDPDTSELDDSVRRIVDQTMTYTEISPTGTGLKSIGRGEKPSSWVNTDVVDLKDQGYFTITGNILDGSVSLIADLDLENDLEDQRSDAYKWAINSMRKVTVADNEADGSGRLIKYARQAVRCGLDDAEGLEAIEQMFAEHPGPVQFNADQILERISQAERRREAEEGQKNKSSKWTFGSLRKAYPARAEHLIDGWLREGETMTFIAASKEGKSWMSYGMALAVATGTSWLGSKTKQGTVLLIDNELRPEELSFRIGTVADSMFIGAEDIEDRLYMETMRGRWPDIESIDSMLRKDYQSENLSLIIVDALYRALPGGISENDNAAITKVFNQIDAIAKRHRCAVALVHHASKGDQSGKSITDVGSGAGAVARATDTHVVLRPHEEDSCAVMEAVRRSGKQPEARSLRFQFPLWVPETSLQPVVRVPKSEADRRQSQKDNEADRQVLEVLKEEVEASMKQIRSKTGLSYDRCNRVLSRLLKSEQVQVTKEIKVRGNLTKIWAILDPIDHLI